MVKWLTASGKEALERDLDALKQGIDSDKKFDLLDAILKIRVGLLNAKLGNMTYERQIKE